MDTLIPSPDWLDAVPVIFSSMLVKSAIILGVGGLLAFALRYSSASMRHMVLTAAMAAILLLPFAFVLLPQWRLPLLPALEKTAPVVDTSPDITANIAPDPFPSVAEPAGKHTSVNESHTFVVVSPENDLHISVTIPEIEIPPVVAEINDFEISIDVSDVVAPVAPVAPVTVSPAVTTPLAVGSSTSHGVVGTLRSIPWQLMLLSVWMAGSLFVLIRLLIAHAGVRLLVRRSTVVDNLDWRYDLDRYKRFLEIEQDIQIRHSRLSSVPMIVGCLRPVLILPDDHLNWTGERRRIVLLHELAHIKRRDCLTQMIAELTCALVWFNPMVWLASRQLRVEREIACDDIVLMSGTRASTYAETILETIKTIRQAEWSPVASIAMARKSDLEGRLIAILDPDVRRKRINRASSSLAVGLIAALALPVAVAMPVRITPQDLSKNEDKNSYETTTPKPAESVSRQVNSWNSSYNTQNYSFEFSDERADIATARAEFAKSRSDAARRWSDGTGFDISDDWSTNDNQSWSISRNSYRSPEYRSHEVALDTLSVEQLIKLRKYGVDSQFITELQQLGYSKLSVDDLIDLAKYGVDPGYIQDLANTGFEKLSVNELVKFSKYGVDSELVAGLKAHGFNVSTDDVVSLSKYGIDEHDIDAYAQAGLTNIGVDELINMSKYGVDPSDIVEYQAAGYNDLSYDDLISLSKFGIDGDDISGFVALGYSNLSVDELINLSKYGVDADEISALVAVGYNDLSVDELVQLTKYGVDADEIAELSVIGYNDLTVQDMINLSKYGLDADDIADLSHGGRTYSIEDLVDMAKYGVDGDEIAKLAAAGYKNLATDDLVKIARYGVDTEEIAQFSMYGYDDLSIDDIIDITKYGVDAELVSALEELGHDNVSMEKLIKMTKYGVDAEYVRELAETGIKLSIDDVIDLGKHGVSADYVRAMKSDGNN